MRPGVRDGKVGASVQFQNDFVEDSDETVFVEQELGWKHKAKCRMMLRKEVLRLNNVPPENDVTGKVAG